MIGAVWQIHMTLMKSGEQLAKSRINKGYGLDEIFRLTGIPVKFLSALEAGDFQALGGRVYVMQYARQYACFLGMLNQSFLDNVVREWEIHALRDAWKAKAVSRWHRLLAETRSYRKFSLFGAGSILLVAVYFFYQLSFLLFPPRVTILSPGDTLSASQASSVVITGEVEEKALVTLNRRPIKVAEEGIFEERLYLAPGLNRIELEAVNVSGRKVSEIRYILYQPH